MKIPQKSRMRALTMPREHGAWGILLVPLIVGGCVGSMVGDHLLPLVPFTIATIALFCLRTPVESLLGTTPMKVQSAEERRTVVTVIVVLSVVSAVALTTLLWGGRNIKLLAFGVVVAAAFGLQAVLKKISKQWRMAAQIAGAAGLTVTAPAAYYLATGKVDVVALMLWVVNWTFAGDQIHFVQLRIHAAHCNGVLERLTRGRLFFAGQLVLIVVLALAWHRHMVPTLSAAAFLPIFARGFMWFFQRPEPLAVRQLGRDELAYAIVFGALTMAGFIA